MLASASAGTGTPVMTTVVVISHAPGLTFRPDAAQALPAHETNAIANADALLTMTSGLRKD
jgi:hypothetical protein